MRIIRNVLFILLFLFLFSSLTRNFFEYKKNYDFYQNYKNEYEKTKQQNTQLKTNILKNSDLNRVEKIIRNKLGFLKPGEVSLVIPNPTPTPTFISPTPQPVYKQWLAVFFKN